MNPPTHRKESIPSSGSGASVEQSISSSLIQLSNGCSKHELYHKTTADKNNSDNDGDGGGSCSSDFDNGNGSSHNAIPHQCRKDLEYIYKIIPFVERECSSSLDEMTATTRNITSSRRRQQQQRQQKQQQDTSNLCQFYRSVVAGSFCPHSHFLFRWGRDGVEILPRVTQLLKHYLKMISSSTTVSTSWSNDIIDTAAQLLNIIPDKELQTCILTDLITLSHDLAAISRMDYFSSKSSSSLDSCSPIEVLLFSTTQQHIQQRKSTTTNNTNTRDTTTTKSTQQHLKDEEYHAIEISNVQELECFKSGLFHLLHTLLCISRDRRMMEDDQQDGCEFLTAPTTRKDDDDPQSSPLCENVESPWFYCLDNYELQSQLINSIKQSVLVIIPIFDRHQQPPQQDGREREEVTSSSSHLSNLVLQQKTEAAKLLFTLLSDDANVYVTRVVFMMPEISRFVAMAVKIHFQYQQQQHEFDHDKTTHDVPSSPTKATATATHSMTSTISLYSIVLTDLVRYTILLQQLPLVLPQEPCTREDMIWSIRYQALKPLLDCMLFLKDSYCSAITKNHNTSVGLTTAAATTLEEMNSLETTVLRAIHTCILTSSSSSSSSQTYNNNNQGGGYPKHSLRSIASSHCTVHGLYLYLFRLLKQPYLGTIAVQILSNLLQPILKHSHYESICFQSWSKVSRLSPKDKVSLSSSKSILLPPVETTRNRTATTATATATTTTSHPSPSRSATKKRTLTASVTKSPSKNYPTQQLNIERSPKRTKRNQTSTRRAAQSNENNHNHGHHKQRRDWVSADTVFVQTLDDAILFSHQILSGTLQQQNVNLLNIEKIVQGAVLVSSVTRLLLDVIATTAVRSKQQRTTRESCTTTHTLKVLCFLLRSLRELYCNNNNSDPNNNEMIAQSVLSLMVDVGLYSHFTIGADCQLQQIHGKYATLTNELDQISHLLLSAWSSKMESTDKMTALKSWYDPFTIHEHSTTRLCRGNCIKFFETFGVKLDSLLLGDNSNSGDEISRRTCPYCVTVSSHLEYESYANNESTSIPGENVNLSVGANDNNSIVFQNDISKLWLEMLPVGTRLILFTCLHPENPTAMPSTTQIICKTLEQPELFPELHVVGTISCIPVLALSVVLQSNQLTDDTNGTLLSQLFGSLSRLQMLQISSSCKTTSTSGGLSMVVKDKIVCRTLNRFCTILNFKRKAGGRPEQISQVMTNAHIFSSFVSSSVSLRNCFHTPSDVQDQTHGGKAIMNNLEQTCRYFPSHWLSVKIPRDFEGINSGLRLCTWQLIAWACLNSDRSTLRDSNAHRLAIIYSQDRESSTISPEGDVGSLPSPIWLLEVPFVDKDRVVRDYASRSLGRVLLGNDCNLLYALFSTEEDWKGLSSARMDRCTNVENQIIVRLFRFIDNLLQRRWSIAPSRVFITRNHTLSLKDPKVTSFSQSSPLEGDSKAFPFLKSALYALSSLCQNADLESTFGVFIFENALHRIVRFWTTFEEQLREHGESLVSDKSSMMYSLSSLAFGEMSRLNLPVFLRSVVSRKHLTEVFLPVLLSDILVPRYSPETLEHTTNIPDRRYRLLSLFIQNFLVFPTGQAAALDKNEVSLFRRKRCLSLTDMRKFLQDVLPNILPALVAEQDYSALRLVTGFNLFLTREKRRLEKIEKAMVIRNELSPAILVGNTMLPSNFAVKGISTNALDEHLKMLCLSPECIEQIIPRLLVHQDRNPLVFFLRHVVKEKLTLPQMIRSAQNKILKNLVLRLGDPGIYDDNEMSDSQTKLPDNSLVVQGIIKGALALQQEKTSSALKGEAPKGTGAGKSSGAGVDETSAKRRIGDEAASIWVSSNFMFVLVNVVQQRWKLKTTRENIQSLRCLRAMLQFLRSADAAQYLPQIMATVNMAMSDENDAADKERKDRTHLRLLAAQVLSQYVRIVIAHEISAIEQDFTTIVVSLFPVLTQKEGVRLDSNHFSFISDACKTAVDLLEWMTSGKLAKKLAPMFAEIPFLPSSPHLDNVRASLKKNGVDFDTLLTLTDAHHTQQQTPYTRDDKSSSVQSSSDGDTLSQERYSAYMLAALQKRLEMLRKLLAHGNTSVRKVVLEHLIDLLRANRGLFHRMVETQDGGSIERFVTVLFSTSNADESIDNKGVEHRSAVSLGGVKELLEALLSRCSLEEDRGNRVLLATCLGEMGGLDSNHIGEVNVIPPENCEGSNSWRLPQPPWKSRAARYELHLVTKHLPMALKAAPSSSDQHKIAFTIQQLLVLLDASVPSNGNDEDLRKEAKSNSSEKIGTETVGTGSTSKRREKMSPWLVEKLEEAGVLADIEPYWSTHFSEVDTYSSRKPPFFRPATSYFNWVSRWSGFMIMQSKNNSKSRWQDLFYACRTSMRSMAGITITEFLLPVLVLDAICFGESIDEHVVLQELKDALTFSKEEDGALHLDPIEPPGHGMSRDERQKAVNTAFSIIDTLQYWAEDETESRHRNVRSSSKQSSSIQDRSRSVGNDTSSEFWSADESIVKIEDFVKAVPLALRANAAACVGMHARSLRLLEMDARSHLVESLFDNTGGHGSSGKTGQEDQRNQSIGYRILHGIDTGLMKQVLGQLGDCETMKAVVQDTSRVGHSSNIIDSIKEKEAYGDWAGAMQDYEMALQLSGDRERAAILERGMLKCLLELGQFESVINQANGMVHRQHTDQNSRKKSTGFSLGSLSHENATPYAIEAAWRLGRWSTLENLVAKNDNPFEQHHQLDVESRYQICVGRAMVGLRKKSRLMVTDAVTEARQALMTAISSSVQESYSRSYPHLLRFHCLREIEDANDILCPNTTGCIIFSNIADAASSQEPLGLSWDDRLNRVSSLGSASIINVRLALAKLGQDPNLEGSLYLSVGKRARKSGLVHIAEKSLAQAEAAFLSLRNPTLEVEKLIRLDDSLTSIRVQMAKVKHMIGESTSALRIIGEDSIHDLIDKDTAALRAYVSKVELKKNQMLGNVAQADVGDIVARFARSLFQSTQWMAEGGLKGGAEVMNRFRVVQKLSPRLEKGYFYFAKYADSLLENRIKALASHTAQLGVDDDTIRANVFLRDASCQNYLLLAMQQYGEALNLNQKHVFQALPRLLTLWFDFTSIPADDLKSPANNRTSGGVDYRNLLYDNQGKANEMMVVLIRSIPVQSFYTSLAQLISRVGHRDRDTVQVVIAILKRVLVKFPSQAMWPLAWLRNSSNKERSNIGEEIFLGAIKTLQKSKHQEMHKLLVASKSLCKYLIDLAKYNPKEANARTFSVRPWKGEVELSAFIPPVQAALSILPASLGRGKSYDVTQTLVPRMRVFSPVVSVMASKARPKKIKVYVIPAQQLRSRQPSGSINSSQRRQPGDIGEIHFLLKQEAKGDLRKDARVQDLNNVINRLMVTASSPSRRAATQQRRLQLRTFAVTCLSEDCGILEWVPETESLRSLVGASYNPQAAPFSTRRRGKRMSGFGDVNLRKNYERCQEIYKKTGDFVKAGSTFEETCLKQNPPLLYWWFVQKFMDPHAWYEARTRFTLSAAAWSAVGHVIGLGDRHSENILVDTSKGDCVHVDFDCIFDKGLTLPAPEVVPFRLTPNMLDAFGPTGADGIFSGSMKNAMNVLRENRETLLNVLEPFLKDPVIDWKRHRSHSQPNSKSSNSREVTSAKRSMEVIDGRLRGIYNLRNPNIDKFRRKEQGGTIQDDEMTHLMPLSVDGQVHKMISEATSHENLVQLYIGWMPWV